MNVVLPSHPQSVRPGYGILISGTMRFWSQQHFYCESDAANYLVNWKELHPIAVVPDVEIIPVSSVMTGDNS